VFFRFPQRAAEHMWILRGDHMQNERSKARRFGQPGGNDRKVLPRLGTIVGKQRLRRIREAAVIQSKIECLNEFEGDSIDLFVSIYRNTSLPLEIRLHAAAKCAQFERPTLAAHAVTNSMSSGLADRLNAAIERVGCVGDDAGQLVETRKAALLGENRALRAEIAQIEGCPAIEGVFITPDGGE
jgi:hypothetical protein